MSDQAEIEALVQRYCDAAKRADLDAFRTLWTADARWTGPGLECNGVAEVTRTFAKLRNRVASTDPTIESGSVTVDGDRATGSWAIREPIVGHDGHRRETVGRYDDEYARTGDGWRFRHRHFTPDQDPGVVTRCRQGDIE